MLPFYKFVFEISSIFTIEAVITSLIWKDAPPLLPMIVLIIIGSIYLFLLNKKIIQQGTRRIVACVILIPLSLVAFLFAPDDKVLVFFAWLYIALLLSTGRTDGNYYSVRSNYFMLTGIVLGLMFVLAAMSYAFVQQVTLLVESMAPFAITMQVSGFLMLRLFREENLMKSNKGYRRYRRLEQVALLGLVGLSWAGNFLDFVADSVKKFYYLFIEPVIVFIRNALGMGMLWIVQLIGKLFEFEWNNQVDDSYDMLKQEQDQAKEALIEAFDLGTEGKPVNFQLIFFVVVGVSATIVAVAIILRLMANRHYEVTEGNVTETRERIKKEKKERLPKAERKHSPRNAIRKAYGKYLRYYKKKKVPLTTSMTTKEIAGEIGKQTNPAAQKQVKDAYRKARYCMNKELSWEEANSFKELIKEQKL